MDKTFLLIIRMMVLFSLKVHAQNSPPIYPAYKNSDLPTEQRIDDLIQRMTPEEKIGQLATPLGWEMVLKSNDSGAEYSFGRFRRFI